MARPIRDAESKSPIRGPADFAAAFGASRETLDRLSAYEQLLRQWQKTINLVAPSTLDAIWHRHFADSAQLLSLTPNAQTWVDLGSGAGFPGLVIALMLAERANPDVPSPLVGEGQGGGVSQTLAVVAPPTPSPSPQGGGGLAPRQGHGVPSPLVGEGQGGGDRRTSAVGIPPTPNPSPRGGGEGR